MVAITYELAMARIFADEGGYTNDPVDPGGATNWGITIIDARKYWKPDATANDVKNMPKSVAASIYRKHYANPMRYDDLPAGFDYSVLDAAINSGVGRAPIWAGKALGITVKNINDVVIPANIAKDKVKIIQKYWQVRLAFLQGLSTYWRFGKGWTRRVTSGEAAAVKMWLTFGAGLPPTEISNRMKDEAAKAAATSKKTGTAAASSGTVAGGSAVGSATPQVDVTSMSLGGKIALAVFIVFMVGLTMYLVNKYLIHKERADAYAAA